MTDGPEKKHLSGKGVILHPPPPPPLNIGLPETRNGVFWFSEKTRRIFNPLRWFRKDPG